MHLQTQIQRRLRMLLHLTKMMMPLRAWRQWRQLLRSWIRLAASSRLQKARQVQQSPGWCCASEYIMRSLKQLCEGHTEVLGSIPSLDQPTGHGSFTAFAQSVLAAFSAFTCHNTLPNHIVTVTWLSSDLGLSSTRPLPPGCNADLTTLLPFREGV